MKKSETNLLKTALLFAGTKAMKSKPRLDLLRETYRDAGLPTEEALAAALADYAQLFTTAA